MTGPTTSCTAKFDTNCDSCLEDGQITFVRNDAEDLIPAFDGEAFPWKGGDLQTMRHFICRDAPSAPLAEPILLDLPDGDRLLAMCHLPNGQPRGCLIAVHGLNGCMDAPHILWLVPAALAAGFALLRVNMRGAGSARALARKTYNAGAGADLIPFVDWAKRRFGALPLFMMGHSLGGTTALNMALDHPFVASQLAGIVTVGAPIDMAATAKKFHLPRNRLYVRYMLAGMKQIVTTTPELEQRYIDAALRATNVYIFDDQVTAHLAGHGDATSYYAASSVHNRLSQLNIPAMVIQSTNDPWVPVEPCLAQPREAGLPSIVVTKGGGHVGFHDRKGSWYIRATLVWIAAQLGKIQASYNGATADTT